MRKYVLSLFFGFVLLWPVNLESKRLYFKTALGVSLGGRVYDNWYPTINSFDYSATPGEKTSPALDVSLELIYQLNSNIGVSLGVGYINKIDGLNGSTGHFSPPDTSGLVNFSYSPWLKATVYPFYLTAVYSYPLFLEGRLNFFAGVGYYIGKIDCLDGNWENEPLGSLSSWSRHDWRFKSNSNTIGFHTGISMEIDLPENVIFFIEALYRRAEFKKFKTSSKSAYMVEKGSGLVEGGSTFFYAKGVNGGEALGDIDYRVSSISLSGLVFRLGLKFKL